MRSIIVLRPVCLLLVCFAASVPPGAPAAELRVTSNFPGGSAKVLVLDSTNNLIRITPAGNPDRGWPCWWYLHADGIDTNQPFTLEVVGNQSRVRGNKPGETRDLSPAWSLPAQAAVSTDNRIWKQTPPGTQRGRQITYRFQPESQTVWLAWGPPFTLSDANALVEQAARQTPFARPFVLAETLEGRKVPALRVSEPGTPASQRYSIWIQARQHAWESGSSWVCRGFTEWLVSKDAAAGSLRRKADITIVPVMDVDNVETGNGGKKAKPTEHNEQWGTSPRFPEVLAAMESISAEVKKGRFAVFLDLHNPGAGADGVFVYIPPLPMLDHVRLENQAAFTNQMRAHMTGPIPFTTRIGEVGTTYDPAVDTTSDAWAAAAGGSYVVSLTVETPWNTPGSTALGYRTVGEQLGRSIERYLRRPPTRGAEQK